MIKKILKTVTLGASICGASFAGLILLFIFIFIGVPRIEALKFEFAGEVPADASYQRDWPIAQYTTWWGKRLDPKAFWKGRTIWLDVSASNAARRHGREYPPIPDSVDISSLADFSDQDVGSTSGGPDSGPFITFYGSYRERVYWDQFWKTHPKPPEDLAREQSQVAQDISVLPSYLTNSDKSRAIQLGYPPEVFTDDALHWCRVGGQSKAANTWKISYLQRLRREHTDESYINAYLKAWNLSATDVFSADNDTKSPSKAVP